MSRALLLSEAAILVEAGASSESDLATTLRVCREYHAPPRSKRLQWFNTDFVLELNHWNHQERPKAHIVPLRPDTMGAEFFVMISPSGAPTQLELLGGESIDKSSFRDEIRMIERIVESSGALLGAINVDTAPYLRVARLKRCVAFVVCSTTEIAALLDASACRVDAGRDLLEYRMVATDVLVDGVHYE